MADLEVSIKITGHVKRETSILDVEDALAVALERFNAEHYGLVIETSISNTAYVSSVMRELQRDREGLIA